MTEATRYDAPQEAANLAVRAELVRQIVNIFKTSGWTQTEAAARCGVTQPRINDLLRGRISRFSLDALVNIATALGRRVHVTAEASLVLDEQTGRAARAFMKRLEGQYPAVEGLLFGSRARGTHRRDSDADIAVILKGEAASRYKVAGDMSGIAFDVMQETGVLVDPLPFWEAELARPELFSNPALIEMIKREGLRL